MRNEKNERRPNAVKLPGRRRRTEAKRLLKARQKELEIQEAKLLLAFAKT